mmetsp:Transcript_69023/g.152317  ORF Transcript_69023/g.152317 Transcript_69023/m.152317 type:complete len:244 (+) Transcript_69023:181-912(+)
MQVWKRLASAQKRLASLLVPARDCALACFGASARGMAPRPQVAFEPVFDFLGVLKGVDCDLNAGWENKNGITITVTLTHQILVTCFPVCTSEPSHLHLGEVGPSFLGFLPFVPHVVIVLFSSLPINYMGNLLADMQLEIFHHCVRSLLTLATAKGTHPIPGGAVEAYVCPTFFAVQSSGRYSMVAFACPQAAVLTLRVIAELASSARIWLIALHAVALPAFLNAASMKVAPVVVVALLQVTQA